MSYGPENMDHRFFDGSGDRSMWPREEPSMPNEEHTQKEDYCQNVLFNEQMETGDDDPFDLYISMPTPTSTPDHDSTEGNVAQRVRPAVANNLEALPQLGLEAKHTELAWEQHYLRFSEALTPSIEGGNHPYAPLQFMTGRQETEASLADIPHLASRYQDNLRAASTERPGYPEAQSTEAHHQRELLPHDFAQHVCDEEPVRHSHAYGKLQGTLETTESASETGDCSEDLTDDVSSSISALSPAMSNSPADDDTGTVDRSLTSSAADTTPSKPSEPLTDGPKLVCPHQACREKEARGGKRYRWPKRADYTKHWTRVHTPRSQMTFACDICLTKYMKKGDARRCQRKHRKERQTCSHCERSFSRLDNMSRHVFKSCRGNPSSAASLRGSGSGSVRPSTRS